LKTTLLIADQMVNLLDFKNIIFSFKKFYSSRY